MTGEKQVTITMRYHLAHIGLANNKCLRGCGEKRTRLHCWWECKLVQPPWKTVWRFCKKLRTELPYDPAIPLLGIYPDKTIIQRDTCTSMLKAQQSKHGNDLNVHWIDEWVKMGGRCTYIHTNRHTMEYYSDIRKNEIVPFL